MKWIGQHIYDQISRFRDDVYLEDISSGTIASGGNLGLDSNNKIVKQSDTGITDLHGAGVDGSANQLLTDDGDGTVTSNSGLTFSDNVALAVTGSVDISPANDIGSAALTIDNDDTDQIALDIDAANIDANVIDISATAVTSANAIFIDSANNINGEILVDRDVTHTRSLTHAGMINLNGTKAAATDSGETHIMKGISSTITDTGSLTGSSNLTNVELASNISAVSASGTTSLIGISNTITGTSNNTIGYYSNVVNGQADIKLVSSADTADYCTIGTTANGATELETVDGGAAAAHLTFKTDGDVKNQPISGTNYWYKGSNTDDYLKLDIGAHGDATFTTVDAAAAAANITLTADGTYNVNSAGLATITSAGVEIANGSTTGATALLIDNDDVDQIALHIQAANTTTSACNIQAPDLTTANAIFVNADSLTSGSAIKLDVDDALTTTAAKSLLVIDYDKAGVTASGQTSTTKGLDINLADGATNHASGNVVMTGANIVVDSASDQGTIINTGLDITVTDADTNVGIDVTCEDGGSDIIVRSSADTGDYCTVAVGANGATTISTNDDDNSGDSAVAHFEIAAEGDITLDADGQIKLEPLAGNNILLDGTVTVDGGSVTGITTLGVDSVSLTAVQTSAESFVDNDTSIMTSGALDNRYALRGGNFELSGYAVSDGSNFMIADIMSGNKAPFQHDDTSVGSDGLTAVTPSLLLRVAGTVMPYAGTFKLWKGWGASAGSGTVDISIFKYTPTAGDATNDSLVLVKNTQFTAGGNSVLRTWGETSFSVAFAAGDILITGIKGSGSSKAAYFTSTIEVEWT